MYKANTIKNRCKMMTSKTFLMNSKKQGFWNSPFALSLTFNH